MLCARQKLHIPRRATAWLLLLCAWMGTGGVLHHTEAGRNTSGHSRHTMPGLHRQGAMPADTCAACQWTQGLQGRTLFACRVPFVLLPLPPRFQTVLAPVLPRTPRLRPSRAPPALFAFC